SSAPAASYAIAASTGSPASRKSTKLMPLTTRPSLTSRHGMTRTLNMLGRRPGARRALAQQRQRVGGIEPSVIERPARDGAGEFSGARLEQGLHVGDRRKAAGGDHRDRYLIGERDRGVEVEPFEKTVTRNIG